MNKILITGAAGFLGYHLINKIIGKKYEIILIDNFNRGKKDIFFKKILKKKKITFRNYDLTKPFKIKDKSIKYIFHFAAHVGVKNVVANPSATINKNILMLINIISALKKFNKKAKIIFFSTSEVYSPLIDMNIANFPLKENTNLIIKKRVSSRDSYYISKLVGEKIVELSGFRYLNLRPHNIYGPRMGFSHVVPEIVDKMLSRKNKTNLIKIFSPNHKRAFCYIDDAINQIVKLSFNKKNYNNVFNIGNSSQEIKIFDLAKKIKYLIGSQKKIIRSQNTPGSPKRRVPDMRKTKAHIKYKKFISLNRGIQNYLKWYREYANF